MSPFLTDEVSPELSPSPSQGKTYSRGRSRKTFSNDARNFLGWKFGKYFILLEPEVIL